MKQYKTIAGPVAVTLPPNGGGPLNPSEKDCKIGVRQYAKIIDAEAVGGWELLLIQSITVKKLVFLSVYIGAALCAVLGAILFPALIYEIEGFGGFMLGALLGAGFGCLGIKQATQNFNMLVFVKDDSPMPGSALSEPSYVPQQEVLSKQPSGISTEPVSADGEYWKALEMRASASKEREDREKVDHKGTCLDIEAFIELAESLKSAKEIFDAFIAEKIDLSSEFNNSLYNKLKSTTENERKYYNMRDQAVLVLNRYLELFQKSEKKCIRCYEGWNNDRKSCPICGSKDFTIVFKGTL